MPDTVGFASHGYAIYASKTGNPNTTEIEIEKINLPIRNYPVDRAIFPNTTDVTTIRNWISQRTHTDVNMNLIASAIRKLYLASYTPFEVIG